MDYQPSFYNQMGPRGGTQKRPGVKMGAILARDKPHHKSTNIAPIKKMVTSYQLVLDSLLICQQKNFQFSPPGGTGGQILKITLWAKTIFAPTFFQNFF